MKAIFKLIIIYYFSTLGGCTPSNRSINTAFCTFYTSNGNPMVKLTNPVTFKSRTTFDFKLLDWCSLNSNASMRNPLNIPEGKLEVSMSKVSLFTNDSNADILADFGLHLKERYVYLEKKMGTSSSTIELLALEQVEGDSIWTFAVQNPSFKMGNTIYVRISRNRGFYAFYDFCDRINGSHIGSYVGDIPDSLYCNSISPCYVCD
jgi:hypothetical protein